MMKKIVFILLGVLLCVSLQAEEKSTSTEKVSKTKKVEKNYFPEQGDFALGVDLLPIFRSIGTIFYPALGQQGWGGVPNYDYTANLTVAPLPAASLMGKYMVTDQWGVRLNLGVLCNSVSTKTLVDDIAQLYTDPLSEAKVTDVVTQQNAGLSIGIGGEYRIGKKRVQGVFGADFITGFYSNSFSFQYGNACTDLNPANRTLNLKLDNAYIVGGQISAGIEVFVCKGIAIGGQVNLSYIATLGGQTSTQTEFYDHTTQKVTEWTDITGNTASQSTFSTNNIGGALYMMFYF